TFGVGHRLAAWIGAPSQPRQELQWQYTWNAGSPVISSWTAPHAQPALCVFAIGYLLAPPRRRRKRHPISSNNRGLQGALRCAIAAWPSARWREDGRHPNAVSRRGITAQGAANGSAALLHRRAMASVQDLEQHRAALTGHCYRMMGSAADADDAVQETMVRAWRGLGGFEERASLRTWLTRIATRVCLDALADRRRRLRPIELEGPGTVDDPLTDLPRGRWIEPSPTRSRRRPMPTRPSAACCPQASDPPSWPPCRLLR